MLSSCATEKSSNVNTTDIATLTSNTLVTNPISETSYTTTEAGINSDVTTEKTVESTTATTKVSGKINGVIIDTDNILQIENLRELKADGMKAEQYTTSSRTDAKTMIYLPEHFINNTILCSAVSSRLVSEKYDEVEDKILLYAYDIDTDRSSKYGEYKTSFRLQDDYYINGYYIAVSFTRSDYVTHFILSDRTHSEVISTIPATLFYHVDALNDNELVFMTYEAEEQLASTKMYKYDIATKKTTILYKDVTTGTKKEQGESKKAFTFDIWKDKIYVLMTQDVDGKRIFSMKTLDMDGNEICEETLTGLGDYSSLEATVDRFTVTDDLYMFNFYNSVGSSNFALVSRDNVKESEQFNKLVPCRRLTQEPLNNRYLIFDTFPDYGDYDNKHCTANLCIYDITTNTFKFATIVIPDKDYSILKLLVNEQGEILCVAETTPIDDAPVDYKLYLTDPIV